MQEYTTKITDVFLSQRVVLGMFCTAAVLSSTPIYAATNIETNGISHVYVYNGAGVCEEGCADETAKMIELMKRTPRFVNEADIKNSNFNRRRLFVVPGGDAIEMAQKWTPEQKQTIRSFVSNGGAYFGLCAGAFFADTKVDDANTIDGLGLLPGQSFDYIKSELPFILPLHWLGSLRYLYFQAGAYFDIPNRNMVEVIATYENGTPAVIRFTYGLGKVVLSGVHPEAPEEWKTGLIDPDGHDFDLAKSLLDWLLVDMN